MAETVTLLLQRYFSAELVVFFISMMPVLELRGGLIAASLLGVPWRTAAIISIIGTMLPVPIILLFVQKVLFFMQKHGPFKAVANRFINKARTKGAQLTKRYPHSLQWALFLFVAIPLPGTGAWTGSLVAAFLGLPIRRSAPTICLGALGAACIMLFLTYVLPATLR